MNHASEPVSLAGGPLGDLSGQTLGDFRVLRRLGQGGMGQVYLAEQLSLKRKVALKILRAELAANATSLQRFKLEAEAVARATHANIVQVYAIGEVRGLHFMALEYVDGRTLRQFVEKKGPPEVPVALSIIRQVAAALQRASELGIIHRDIKPDNILLTRQGEAKVADFGLSRVFAPDQQAPHLTQSGVAMGTPLYMAPEQVENRPVDPRTDIYSFGVTCYFMLAGHPPFRGETPFEVAVQHVTVEPKPLAEIRPDLPPALCAIVHRMMAKAPDLRYPTGKEIIKEVAQLRDNLVGLTTNPPSPSLFTSGVPLKSTALSLPQPVPAKTGGKRFAWWAALSLLLALSGGVLWAWLNRPTPAPATEESPPKDEVGEKFEPQLSPRKEREQLLVAEVGRPGKGGETSEELRLGLNYATELGLLYLEDRRLDEAEEHFKQLEAPDRHVAYRTLGRLGRAVVLAYRDQPAESNKLIRELIPAVRNQLGLPPFGAQGRMWFQFIMRSNRQFRRTLARAVNHNYDNDPQHFPRELEFLRWPPPVTLD
jgi:serine/threonine-protein kinase